MSKIVHFDWAIKNLLRHKANFDILEGFLSELLKTKVTIETLLESESNKDTREDKSNRVDLLVLTEQKEHVIIEVQASMEWDYLSRILYGTSKAVTEYIQAGQAFRHVRKIISVNIVFFDLGHGEDYVYHGTTEFRGTHQHDILRLGENEKKAYALANTPSDIFPEYYLIKVNQFNERIKDKFDEWVYFLKTERIQPDFSAQGVKSAAKKLDVLTLDAAARQAYERYEYDSHYEASMHESHYGRGKLDGLTEGKAEGKAEGLAEGKAEGLAEGEAKGKTEGKTEKAVEVAKKLRELGAPLSMITESTGLTAEEIEALH
ncbi:MAG: Rpn family recombination-promoting nuclease/putative transposase [Gammaproteobacteria bacterium]|nr:Rpn family recombination-promoting nuclease/putative transposase [Gammaproteobacteria bacterium]